jgi:uncharacterized protein (TIGR01777 family)
MSADCRLDVSGLDAVVHLAGESLLGYWTSRKKRRIRDSRIDLTRHLVSAMAEADPPPRVLVSASAVGFYGDREDVLLTESSPRGCGFLAELVADWEAAAAEAERHGIRVVCLRFGIILARHGGALPVLRRIFRLGLGGSIGSGRQWMSWLHVDDAVRLVREALHREDLTGPVNAASPAPVTNRRFTKSLANHLHRPAFMPAPAAALRLLLREQSSMFLSSQRVHPKKLLVTGYSFAYPDLDSALSQCFATA